VSWAPTDANGIETYIASGGDLQMLQWTTAGGGARLMGLVHHTDAARENEAQAKGWTIADMQRDWKVIFAFEKK
jgi:hypothetical protein